MARNSLHQLISFDGQHLFDKEEYDFFAASMPEPEVYQDDIRKRSNEYCRDLIQSGRTGLQLISATPPLFDD